MLYLMTPHKNWLRSEMEINGVLTNTVQRWRLQGRYGNLVFHRCRREVFVSGTTLPLPLGNKGKLFHFNWHKADWTQRNREIATVVGCRQNTVAWARQRFAPESVKRKKK